MNRIDRERGPAVDIRTGKLTLHPSTGFLVQSANNDRGLFLRVYAKLGHPQLKQWAFTRLALPAGIATGNTHPHGTGNFRVDTGRTLWVHETPGREMISLV